MDGYWRDDAATKAALTTDGFVRTGDLGWIDQAGRLRLVGRTKDMYIRGGYNVFPMEVEGVLARHPSDVDIAVVPRHDQVMGQVGVAV
ncbi:MAG: class I adenylate-forming enzyme family protein, partial [Acidimicrobiales bacterium]